MLEFPANNDIPAIERGATLTDQAYARLRVLILAGAFSPGEKISIRKLSEKLQISFTPAREALLRLAVERAVVVTATRNVSVAKLRIDDVNELYLIRETLEGLATEYAVPNIPAKQIKELENIQERMSDAYHQNDYRRALQCNYDTHFGIYRHCKMPELIRIIEGIWLRIGPSLNLLYPTYQKSRRGIRHHTAALAAIQDRDSKLAREIIVKDIVDGREELIRALQSKDVHKSGVVAYPAL